jgi:hypothetical protein
MSLIPDFGKFCIGWVKEYGKLKDEGANTKRIGHAFENYFLLEALRLFIPDGYVTAKNQKRDGVKVRGNDYKFDLLLVKKDTLDYDNCVPSDVLAAFEVKSRGFYGDKQQERVKYALEVENRFPHISLFYVAFREREDYDADVRRIFGNVVKRYYRLADSGNGEMPPPKCFPEEWKRLIHDLSALKH